MLDYGENNLYIINDDGKRELHVRAYSFGRDLQELLIAQGYSRTAVEKSIEQANRELASEAPILKEKPTIVHDIIDENNMPVKKSWFHKLFGL